MITTNLTGNLGNHMWQYAVCRAVAQKLGYKWGVNPSPTHDYHNGMNQMYFMDVDFGNQVEGEFKDFYENWLTYNNYGDLVNITLRDDRVWSIDDNTRLIGHNGAFGGIYQTESYFEGIEEKVKEWFHINPKFEKEYNDKLDNLGIKLDDNLCIINFRGGEYRGIPKVVCRPEYWRDSINHMKSLNPQMKFLVVTDDPSFAIGHMPFNIDCLHVDIGFDFYCVKKSKWVILSNSSFGWWAAWLNDVANKIIAPKYWASHNTSNGFWSVGEIYTKKFDYMNRDGILNDYNTCKIEAENFYKSKNII
jgi:hypothetical protein